MDNPTIDRLVVPPQTADDGLRINRITIDQPWEWLAKGWRDIQQARKYSLTYGAVIVLISAVLTWALVSEGYVFIVPFLAAGFFLLAPVVALGLYQMSAHVEKNEPLQFCNALEAWKRNQGQLSIITAGLIIIMQFWMMANFVLFALLYTSLHPPLESFFSTVFLSGENNAFVFASVLLGFVLAGIAYAISAISVPMLVDRKVDGFTAIRTSVKAVTTNWLPMALWAAIIVMGIGAGFLTFYVGLVIAMPLLGHATWHAYRDLVPQEPERG